MVVCTRNRPQDLFRCLEAISHLVPGPTEVVVVDNAPDDRRSFEATQFWRARYLVEPVVGLSRARNLGALAAKGEVVAFLDDDAVPEPDWLLNLALEFQDSRVMAAGGKNRPLPSSTPDGDRIGEYCIPLDQRERCVIDQQTENWFELASFGGLGDGCNMAFRRRAFDFWKGFDPRLGRGAPIPGGEEHFAFFSLINLGYRVAYTPEAVVRHRCPETLAILRSRELAGAASATAYLTLLFAEKTGFRLRVMRYVMGALFGKRRHWRKIIERPQVQWAPWWSRALAYVSGPLWYLRTRTTQRSICAYPDTAVIQTIPVESRSAGPKSNSGQ